MAESFIVSFTSRDAASLVISGYNNGPTDPNVYLKLSSSGTFDLLATEKLRALIVPTSFGMTPAVASGHLEDDHYSDDRSEGILTFKIENDTLSAKTYGDIDKVLYTFNSLPKSFENTMFDLHWLQALEGQSSIYGNYTGIAYTYPHNLQASEVTLTMEPINSGYVRYYITYPAIVNSGNALYTGLHQPYNIGFFFPRGTYHAGEIASGTIDGSNVKYVAGQLSGYAPPKNTGFILDLPLYDPRMVTNKIPASYDIYLGYSGVSRLDSTPLTIYSRHSDFLNNKLPAMDSAVSTTLDISKLQRAGEVTIDKNVDVIQRDRLSVGIKDIAIKENSYEKQGFYISPRYTHENGIYTFSLKVKETIPAYPAVDPYSVVKYYIEFNGISWEPISPTNRGKEYNSEGKMVPKLIVFDKGSGEEVEGIKYLNFSANITSFRLKIMFDISSVPGLVVPPEVWDYRCIIFDKKQLLEL